MEDNYCIDTDKTTLVPLLAAKLQEVSLVDPLLPGTQRHVGRKPTAGH